jgi:integrase
VNLFLSSCKKTYLDEIDLEDMQDFKTFLGAQVVEDSGEAFSNSTVYNYFLKTIVFLNDAGISKFVPEADWVKAKDWPKNVDKKNKNKKYAVYTESEFAAMLSVAMEHEPLLRFLAGTGYRVGEAAVAQWKDINFRNKEISVRFKAEFGFKPKDWEERTITLSDTLIECLRAYGRCAADDDLIFPSPVLGTVDKHLDRRMLAVMRDPIRIQIDSAIASRLKLPDLTFVRELLDREPGLTGRDIVTRRSELVEPELPAEGEDSELLA